MVEKKRRDGSKTERYEIRLSREDMQKLEFASQQLGMSKSDIIRKGISIEYDFANIKAE